MITDKRHPMLITELPGTFFANLVCNYLDPGLRLALRETCKTFRTAVDTYSRPHCRLGGLNTLQDRFLILSQVSDGIEELDVSSCDADLSADAAAAVLPPNSWQNLERLTCHYKQMILVNTLVKQSPSQLVTVSISARKGNWQHAGLLLQQLHSLSCLRTLELALPAQHKLDELIAGLTQVQSLKLTAAPRTPQGGHWPLIPLLGASNKSAKVDAAFWQGAICPLTQLTSLQLSLPLTEVDRMRLHPLTQLQQLQCCCGRDVLPELLENISVLQGLTSCCIDAKVGRRISPMALAESNMQPPDLQPLGQLTSLVQLQLNLHQIVDVAALLPLRACKQLRLLGVSRLQLQLPWRRAELSPAGMAAADAAEAALITAVMAGQLDVPVAQVLLARAGMARVGTAANDGLSNITLPLLPQLSELRIGCMMGKLPLAVIAPQVSELCLLGRKRVWSHQRGFAAVDDMEAFMNAMGVGQGAPWMQGGPAGPGAAAAQNFPGGQVVGVFQGALVENNAQAAGPAGGQLHPPGGAGAAGQQPNAAGPAPAAAGQGQGAAGGAAAAAAPAAGAGPFVAPPPPMFGAPPATLRARAAAQAAEVMIGLPSLQTLDLNFTQLCGMCVAPGGRAVLDGIVELTVLMRGAGSVPGGVPHMPKLKRLCFYDDCDAQMPGDLHKAKGRPLAATYDQKEDHQLWKNQSIEELTLSGSFILGGFFDSNALLRAKAQFPKLRRWVFRDCMDLSAGHLAALLAVRVAPIVRLEGATVLTHNDVRALVALNPESKVELQWAAHIPPNVGGPAGSREYLMGVMGLGLDVMGPWDAVEADEPMPALIDVEFGDVNMGQQFAGAGPAGGAGMAAAGAAAGAPGGAAAAAMLGGPQQQQQQQAQPPGAGAQVQQQQAGGPGGAGPVQVAFGAPMMFQMPVGAVAGGGGAGGPMAAIMQQLQAALGGPGVAQPGGGAAGGAGAGAGGPGPGGIAQHMQQMMQNVMQAFPPLGLPQVGAQIVNLQNAAQAAGGGGAAGDAGGGGAAPGGANAPGPGAAAGWQFDEADQMSDDSQSDEDDDELGGWVMG